MGPFLDQNLMEEMSWMNARDSADRDSPCEALNGKMPGDAEYCETGDDHKGHATNQTAPKTFAGKIGAHESDFLVAYQPNIELSRRCLWRSHY